MFILWTRSDKLLNTQTLLEVQKTWCVLPREVDVRQGEEGVAVKPVEVNQDAASLDAVNVKRFLGFGCKLALNDSTSSVWNNINVTA